MENENEGQFQGWRRQRSSRRLRHEAEVKVFQNQMGSLEGIRNSLGLRPSQICEILKVHPSAWTRWSKADKAPPHVYQMLEWYMELLKWRGQHNPLKGAVPQAMRREDIHSYVPEADSKLRPPRSKLIRNLTIIWIVQALLWCILMVKIGEFKGHV